MNRENKDVSPAFVYNERSAAIGRALLRYEATPRAIKYFAEKCHLLDDYAYWFFLSTCWVSYSGWSDLRLWRRLFLAQRPGRAISIMKPSELAFYNMLPETITAYRAHRPGEEDWIAYTLVPSIAARLLKERPGGVIKKYEIPKKHCIAFFARRGEAEIIVLDKTHATLIAELNQ